MRLGNNILAAVFCILPVVAESQDTWYGSLSGLHLMYNPAYTGSAGASLINLSCYSFLPGGGFNTRSVFASWEGYSEFLHGGAGVWVSDDMTGDVMNSFKTGMTYSFHLKAHDNLYFNAGITASVIHNGINRGAITLPDDYDPFGGMIGMPSEVITERGKTLFDVSAGICFSAGRWYGGFSAMHLAQPYLTSSQNETNRLRRLFTVNAGGEIPVRQGKLLIRPHAALLTQHDRLIIQSGLSVSYRELLLGLSVWNIRSGFFVVEPSAGWKTGIVTFTISYNYNIAGNYDYLQGAAIVKAGVKISVNNVEKRKPVHIINIPEL